MTATSYARKSMGQNGLGGEPKEIGHGEDRAASDATQNIGFNFSPSMVMGRFSSDTDAAEDRPGHDLAESGESLQIGRAQNHFRLRS